VRSVVVVASSSSSSSSSFWHFLPFFCKRFLFLGARTRGQQKVSANFIFAGIFLVKEKTI
jgi:hypothetical protein